MKKIIFLLIFLCPLSICYAYKNSTSIEKKNIAIVKEMFSEFAEKLDVKKLDIYYTKNFILESNGERYSYQEYKNLEEKIYRTLKSLKVTKYDDIFSTSNKVVSRMSIKLTHIDGKTNEFQIILIALIKDNKIDRIWELTYPSWSDKLSKEI